jgi:hypothetical protein
MRFPISNVFLYRTVLSTSLLCVHAHAEVFDKHAKLHHQANGGINASDILPAIPLSNATVSVKIFNGFHARGPPSAFFRPAPGSLSNESTDVVLPGLSFLIEHAPTDYKVMFDLGYGQGGRPVGFEILDIHNIPDQLTQNGVPLANVDAVIWRCVKYSTAVGVYVDHSTLQPFSR